jgi:opacity protein-like surface antigen
VKKTLIMLAMGCTSGFAIAADNFSGFSAELGFSNRSSEGSASDFRIDGTSVPISIEKIENTSSLTGVALRYTARLNDLMFIGLGYERDLQDAKMGPVYASIDGTREMAAEFATIRNTQKFVLSPSYKVNEKMILSVRVGYIQSTTDIGSQGEETDSIKASGSLMGLGAQYSLTDSVYISGSYDSYSFKSKTFSRMDEGELFSYKFKPGGSSINLSVGYRF